MLVQFPTLCKITFEFGIAGIVGGLVTAWMLGLGQALLGYGKEVIQ